MLIMGTLLQGRYGIVRQIGGGGMGVVYLAEDTRLAGRRCAIKEMSPAQLPPQDRTWATNAFRQEAQMLANLKHHGLTPVTDFFPEGGNWYLVMDFVEGETLEERLEKAPEGRLPLSEALNVTRQLCDVLEYLHSQHPPVVFRDLKPGNVMLTPQGEVKLIDFGIARFFKMGQTRDTINLGTPGYAAPELFGGLGQSDPRSDVYSLGALLLHMVTGYDPVLAVTPFPLPAAGSLMPGLPPYVEEVISRATQLSPDSRYSSVGELRQVLLSPVQTVRSPITPTKSPYTLPAPRSELLAGPVWSKLIWIGIGVAGVLLLGLCIVTAMGLRPWLSYQPVAPSPTDIPPPGTPTASGPINTASSTPIPTSTPAPQAQPAHLPESLPVPSLFSIAFDSQRDGHWEVYLMDENGLNVVNLTNHPANDGDPTWSPDGKRIAFDSDRDGNWEIYAMNRDGSEVTRLTNHRADDDSPAWSPDGSRIAFKSNRDGNWEIYVVNLDNLGVTNLTNHPGTDQMPAWSPDNRRIAFVSYRTGDLDIWVMNADGSDLDNLTRHPAKDSFPAWSPDGQRIAFHSYRDGNAEIYVMNADGSGLARLTNHPAEDWGPSWSPDGSRLAFTSDRDGDDEIYVIDTDGQNVVQITYNGASDTWPAWSPMP